MASDQSGQDHHQANTSNHRTNDNINHHSDNNNRSTQEQCHEEGPSHQSSLPVSPERHPGYAVPPPAIGYPYPPSPSPGQPPYNYQPYPPLPSNYANQPNYPHAQAPPAPYYYANPNNVNYQNYPYALASRESPSSRFFRSIIVTIMILLLVTVTCSYVLNMVYRPKAPAFHVDAFAVSNFNASSPSGLASTWDVALSIKNRNTKLKANFEGADSYIYYQDKNVLASSFIQPFSMETGAVTTLRIRMASGTGGDAAVVAKDVVAGMADEKAATGAVVFGLRVRFETTFKSGYYSKLYLFEVDCHKLKVIFDNNGSSSNGSLVANDDQRECDLFVYQ